MFDRQIGESDIIISKNDAQLYIDLVNRIKLESTDRFLGQIDEQYSWRRMKISIIYEGYRKMFIYMIYKGWKRVLINFISAILALIAYPIVVILFIIDKTKYYTVNRGIVKEKIVNEITLIIPEDTKLLSYNEMLYYCDFETYKAHIDKYQIMIEYSIEDKNRIIEGLNYEFF